MHRILELVLESLQLDGDGRHVIYTVFGPGRRDKAVHVALMIGLYIGKCRFFFYFFPLLFLSFLPSLGSSCC